jgi:histone-lysine N-methyltransferase SETMAR
MYVITNSLIFIAVFYNYLDFLECSLIFGNQCIRRKRPELREGGWLLHHDNARPHVARIVRDFLESHGIETVPHPPYSPDLAPRDFYLFPNLKKALKGKKIHHR